MIFLDESHLYIRKNINFAHLFKEKIRLSDGVKAAQEILVLLV